jgi:PAS domain S-box-containing protein
MVRSASAVPPSRDIDLACQALQDLRRQLTSFARTGDVTPGLLQAAADDCPDPVLVTDEKARIIMVNGPTARLLGTSTRELQKLTIWDVTHTTYQADFDLLWREFLRAGRQRGQSGVRHRDGSVVEVAYCAEANVLGQHSVIILRRLT